MRIRHAIVLNDQSLHVGRLIGRHPVWSQLVRVVDDRGVVRRAHARCLFEYWEH